MTDVKVFQLTSDYNRGAFLNVEIDCGMVSVWGSCYEKPTILIRRGITFQLLQFDDEKYFQEWMEENSKEYHIQKIEFAEES